MLNNLRWNLRLLAKSPGFTAIAVMVLALGTGANVTLFSIIETILIKPVMARHPEQLVGVYQHDRDKPESYSCFSYPDFADLRSAREAAFTDLFAIGFATVGVRSDLTEQKQASLVSDGYFSALGVPPALGRGFMPEEETSGVLVAVLTHEFWTRLGADPSIVGKKLQLTRGEVTVVGVMPRGFSGAQTLAPAMFLPLGAAGSLNPEAGPAARGFLTDRADRRFMVMGRLRPGLARVNADAALAGLNQRFAIPDPANPKPRALVCLPPNRFNFSAQPERTSGSLAPVATLASGLSMLVLLIACLNLGSLVLARGASRQKEIAVRLALGAGRGRILGQLLSEGLVLALLGGAGGLLVSAWATRLLAAIIYSGSGMPADFPKFDFSADWRVLLATILLSGLAALLFSLGPALSLSRADLNGDLKIQAGRGARKAWSGRFGAKDLLAAGQTAAALVLMVAAMLFSRSAIRAAGATPGFDYGANFYVSIDPGLASYPEPRLKEIIPRITERLSALPGVESVSPALNIPFGNSWSSRPVQIGGVPSPAGGREFDAVHNIVGADYFRTMGIPLRRGREFERREAETTNGPSVAVISENLAQRLWPGGDPLGRAVQFPGDGPGGAARVMTVVGVVPAIHWRLFENESPAGVYTPVGQDFRAALKFHVRPAPGVGSAGLMAAAREELRKLDSRIPVTEIRTLSDLHHDGPPMRVVRIGSLLFGAFGALAAGLSLLGVYGLKARAVVRRAREIGIRMALGATRGDVSAMIIRETVALAGFGVSAGLLLAVGVGKLAGGFLYGVPGLDPLTFGIAPLLLLLATVAACLVPARRASRVDPVSSLRSD